MSSFCTTRRRERAGCQPSRRCNLKVSCLAIGVSYMYMCIPPDFLQCTRHTLCMCRHSTYHVHVAGKFGEEFLNMLPLCSAHTCIQRTFGTEPSNLISTNFSGYILYKLVKDRQTTNSFIWCFPSFLATYSRRWDWKWCVCTYAITTHEL